MRSLLKKESKDFIEIGRQVIRIEADALTELANRIGEDFEKAIDLIYKCQGRIIVTGMGKSGIVATKIAATLTSTGTAAIFMHAAEGVHGDLGLIKKDDVVICISKSGNTGELTRLFPALRTLGVPIISLTGNLKSALAERSDVVLDVNVGEEACPHDLAPTTSSTAALAMGDALAVALLKKRNFSLEDFAFLHPGGSLGKKLHLKIEDIMFRGDKVPKVQLGSSLHDAIIEITQKRFGCTCVVDDKDVLHGIITDGDLRRLLEKRSDIWEMVAKEVMNVNPRTVQLGVMAIEAFRIMQNTNIMQVVVIDAEGKPAGMIHLHDFLEAGVS